MGGSSSKSTAMNDNSDKKSGAELSVAAGEGANVRAFSVGDSNFTLNASRGSSVGDVTMTDFGAVASAVDLAEVVSMAAINAGRDVAGDAFAYAGAAGSQAERATREAMSYVSQSAENDSAELVATLAKYGAAVVVVVAVVLLMRSKK